MAFAELDANKNRRLTPKELSGRNDLDRFESCGGRGGVKGSDPDAMSFSLDRGIDAMKMICFISHIK